MSARGWRAAVVLTMLMCSVFALPVFLSSASAARKDTPYTVQIKMSGAYIVKVCLRSDAAHSDCTGNIGAGAHKTLTIQRVAQEHVFIDFYVEFGPEFHGYDVTWRTWCNLSGTVQAAKMECEHVGGSVAPSTMPPISPFDPSKVLYQGKRVDVTLLNLLAWCVSAAGVIGVLLVGANLALQLRRGEMGFESVAWRNLVMIAIACILAITAAPIVRALNIAPKLENPPAVPAVATPDTK